jgi:hypothetical protein
VELAWWARYRERIWRGAVVLYALYIFVLIAFYITVAGQSLSYSYTISGQSEVVSGQGAALRLGIYEINKGRFVPGAGVEVDFVQGAARERVFVGQTSAVGLGDVNLRVPAGAAAGAAAWEVRLRPPSREEARVEIPIQVRAAAAEDGLVDLWSEAAATVAPVSSSGEPVVDEGEGPLRLELFADGGAPVDGLPTVFFVHASSREAGAPARVRVKVEVLKGMLEGEAPGEVSTDEGGLGVFTAIPVGSQRWRLSASSVGADGQQVESRRELVVKSELTQHSLTLEAPVWEAGEPLRAQVRSLRRGVVYGDVYQGARWGWSEVTGVGPQGAGFVLPERAVERPGAGFSLARVQVYADALQPGKAGDARYVVVPAAEVGEEEILRGLLGRAAEVGVLEVQARGALARSWWVGVRRGTLRRHIAFWLSRLPRELSQPPLLKDTQDDDRAQMEGEKDEARLAVTRLLVGSGALGLLLLLYTVVSNLLRVRREGRAALVEAAAELSEEDAAALLAGKGGLERAEALLQLVLLFGTVAMFFAAIVVLLQFL